jgi:hypothetical protein
MRDSGVVRMEDGKVVGYSQDVYELRRNSIAKGDRDMTTINCPTEEQVRARAYQIYLEHGGQHGRDRDDWLQAEYELLQLPIQKIAKLDAARPKKKDNRKLALVNLIQAAVLLGAEALPHLKT